MDSSAAEDELLGGERKPSNGAQQPVSGRPVPVALVGASGRLGRHTEELLGRSDGYQVVARLGRGEVTAERLRQTGAVLGMEMTCAGQGFDHALAMLEGGVRPLVATSGVAVEQVQALNERALELSLGGLVVPNFSLGMWLLQKAAAELAPYFARAEIVELHHAQKHDAPSGTALRTRELMAHPGAQANAADIPIHSLRLPGVLANQEVVFGGAGELLRVSHETYSNEAYNAGILASLAYVATATGVGHGIEIPFESAGIPTGSLHPTGR